MKTEDPASRITGKSGNAPQPGKLSRRELLAGGVAATAFSIVPRHVLGGAGFVAPSEKITLGCIGFGTQAGRTHGLRKPLNVKNLQSSARKSTNRKCFAD